MKGNEIEQTIYSKLVNLNYSRKENFLNDVSSTNWFDLDGELKEVILSFPSRFVDYDADLMDIEDLDRGQQFYLFHSKGDTFLVDTQGYNYPRYTTLLEGFDDGIDYDGDEDDIIERGTGITRIADQEIFEQVISNLCTDLSADGFSKKDALVFLQVLLDHKFDCVVDRRKALFP